MKWQFNIQEGAKNLALKAEDIYTTHQIEGIRVTGNGISIVLQNNRPLLEAIELKQPLTWKLMEGELSDSSLLEKIKKEVETYLTNPQNKQKKQVDRQAG